MPEEASEVLVLLLMVSLNMPESVMIAKRSLPKMPGIVKSQFGGDRNPPSGANLGTQFSHPSFPLIAGVSRLVPPRCGNRGMEKFAERRPTAIATHSLCTAT